VLLRQMSRNINIRVINKQTASERLRAIFATRWQQGEKKDSDTENDR